MPDLHNHRMSHSAYHSSNAQMYWYDNHENLWYVLNNKQLDFHLHAPTEIWRRCRYNDIFFLFRSSSLALSHSWQRFFFIAPLPASALHHFFLYEYNSAYSDTVISFFQLFINVFVVTFVDNGTMLIFFFLLFLPCVKRIHFHQHCCMYVCVAQWSRKQALRFLCNLFII